MKIEWDTLFQSGRIRAILEIVLVGSRNMIMCRYDLLSTFQILKNKINIYILCIQR